MCATRSRIHFIHESHACCHNAAKASILVVMRGQLRLCSENWPRHRALQTGSETGRETQITNTHVTITNALIPHNAQEMYSVCVLSGSTRTLFRGKRSMIPGGTFHFRCESRPVDCTNYFQVFTIFCWRETNAGTAL